MRSTVFSQASSGAWPCEAYGYHSPCFARYLSRDGLRCLWASTRRALRAGRYAADGTDYQRIGVGYRPVSAAGAAATRRSRPAPWICGSSKRWSHPIRWRLRRPGRPSMPVSGRAAPPKPAPSGATITPRIGLPLASPSSPAGSPPGWSIGPGAAAVGPPPGGCDGGHRERPPLPWPPNTSAPGGATRGPRPRGRRCPASAATPATTRSSGVWPWPTSPSAA